MSNIKIWQERSLERGIGSCEARDEELIELRAALVKAEEELAELKGHFKNLEIEQEMLYQDMLNQRDAALAELAALQAALDAPEPKPEPEPYAWAYVQPGGKPLITQQPPSSMEQEGMSEYEVSVTPLYTRPAPAKPLTEHFTALFKERRASVTSAIEFTESLGATK
jgi:hypothetical protein